MPICYERSHYVNQCPEKIDHLFWFQDVKHGNETVYMSAIGETRHSPEFLLPVKESHYSGYGRSYIDPSFRQKATASSSKST